MRENIINLSLIAIFVLFLLFALFSSAKSIFELLEENKNAYHIIQIQEAKLIQYEGIIRGLRIELEKCQQTNL